MPSDRLNPHLILRDVGKAIHGPAIYDTGKQAMADALRVTERRYRRWINGEQPIPAGVWDELVELIEKEMASSPSKATELGRLRDRIRDLFS